MIKLLYYTSERGVTFVNEVVVTSRGKSRLFYFRDAKINPQNTILYHEKLGYYRTYPRSSGRELLP